MNQHLTEQQLIDYGFKLADAAAMNEVRTHLEQCESCRRRLQSLVRKFAALDLLRDEIQVPEDLLANTVANAVHKRSMGILPMCRRAILALPALVFHGRDARDTHGQDAHATVQTPPAARRSKVILLYRIPALGAVAAALVVGLSLLLVSPPRPGEPPRRTVVPELSAEKSVPASSADEAYAFREDQRALAGADGAVQAGRPGLAPSEPLAVVGSSAPDARPRRSAALRPEAAPKTEGQVRSVPVRADSQAPDDISTDALDAATPTAQARDIAEKPPFAPASAIELVVLPRRQNVQLTIYNGADLTLVRERRNLTLKRGWNWLQFMWANTLIDPTSLSLEPLEHKDAVQVQQLVFPPRLRELGRWLIRSEIDGQVPFELTYFTSGLAWRAFYLGTLSQDEETMHLEGYVRVNNRSGEDYEDAQTRVIVGRVHLLEEIRQLAQRQYAYGRPSPIRGSVGVMDFEGADRDKDTSLSVANGVVAGQFELFLDRKEIQKEGLSEYFLYTIAGTETIPNQWGKRLLSFETNDIPVTGLYKYDEERWGTQTIRFLSFANNEEHKLGQTPIPDGAVRIYGQAGEPGHLSYVAAMDIKYIPVGEEIELNLGPARLVEVKPILMDCRSENHVFDNNGNVSGWDEVRAWRIEIANTRPLPVEVEVTRGFETPYWTLRPADEEISYTKHDATRARFKLAVGPRSKQVFEYTVTTYHGVREQTPANDRSNEQDRR